MICQVPRLTYIGKLSPSAIAATSNIIATAVLIHLLNFVYLRKNPSATASNINNMEVVATAPFAATFVTAPASFATNPLKKQFFSKLSDIRFDDISDSTSFILYRCVHGCKILHSSKEYTSDEDPEQNRQPAENCGLDRAVDRARTCYGCKLMAKYYICIGRYIINSVLQLISRSFAFGSIPHLFWR